MNRENEQRSFFIFDPPTLADRLENFIRRFLLKSGCGKVVLGLSGGLDSALVLVCAVRALGLKRVFPFILPYRASAPDNIMDAKNLASLVGTQCRTIPITPMIEAYFSIVPCNDSVRRGNKMARERMSILFDQAKALDALVLGTGNRSEILLGYTTLFGDQACSFNPVGNIYKTEIFRLAEYLDVPQRILDKQPSADLWHGQTDADELGFTYAEADPILFLLADADKTPDEIEAMGYPAELIREIEKRMTAFEFKRVPPPNGPVPFRRSV